MHGKDTKLSAKSRCNKNTGSKACVPKHVVVICEDAITEAGNKLTLTEVKTGELIKSYYLLNSSQALQNYVIYSR